MTLEYKEASQCGSCHYFAESMRTVLGGRAARCQLLDEERSVTSTMVAGLMMAAARRNECPDWEPRPVYPDMYRSEDLKPDPEKTRSA